MNTRDDKLLKLIEQKAFTELSTVEKAFVLDHIPEEEYALQRKVLHMSAELIEEESSFLTPDTRIASNLREAVGGRQKRISVWERVSGMLKQPIPAYQLAAALVALLVLFAWMFNGNPTKIIYKDKIVYQEKHDTVYVDKPVVEIQTVEKIVKVVEYVVKSQEVSTLASRNRAVYISEKERMEEAAAKNNSFAFTDVQLEQQKEKSFGNSRVDTQELARLIGVLD